MQQKRRARERLERAGPNGISPWDSGGAVAKLVPKPVDPVDFAKRSARQRVWRARAKRELEARIIAGRPPSKWNKRPGKLREGATVPVLVLVLQVLGDGAWHPYGDLRDALPDVKKGTLGKALFVLRRRGKIETRPTGYRHCQEYRILRKGELYAAKRTKENPAT